MNFLYKFVELLTPKSIIGGLEISDVAIRFLQIGSGNSIIRQEAVRLEPGIIRNGVLKDPARFIAALSELKNKIEPRAKQSVHVVLSVTGNNVYSNTIFLPEAAQENLAEAAELNIRMSSPTKLEYAYHDWHLIKRKEQGQTSKIELLSAVIGRDIMNAFIVALQQNHFVVVAVDFTALSIVRITRRLKTNVNNIDPYVMLSVSPDGLDFFIMRAGELYFDHFQSWDGLRGTSGIIGVDSFRERIANEVVRLVNFYASQYNVSIKHMVISAPEELFDEVKRVVAARVGELKIESFEVQNFDHLPAHWAGTLGAALRARTPRYEDAELSLGSISAKEEYNIVQLTAFAKLWRNVIFTTMLFLVAIFSGTLMFLVKLKSDVRVQLRPQLELKVDAAKLDGLQASAREVNTLIDYVGQVSKSVTQWTSFLRRIKAITPDSIGLERISLSRDGLGSVAGVAESREALLAYRDLLKAEPGLSDVVLPSSCLFGSIGSSIHCDFSFKVDVKAFDKY